MGQTITFSGLEWKVKHQPDQMRGPGRNYWSDEQVWVDDEGRLHLRLAQSGERWYCAEVESVERFGYGQFTWRTVGYLDLLAPQVVAGLFVNPPPEVGPAGTNGIDIEIAYLPHLQSQGPSCNLVYGVYPSALETGQRKEQAFRFDLTGTYTTHQFRWTRQRVDFKSWHGHEPDHLLVFGEFNHAPVDWEACMPSQSMPVHINLWLLAGKEPEDGKAAEIIIRDFVHTPLPAEEILPLQVVERQHIRKALEFTDWRIRGPNGAALLLGLNEGTLRSRMKKLGIERPPKRGDI
ncbi:MAG: hypothetical protein GKR89_25050 [Candidatus Latescibacteria bacterium]|nr:hypothetical protein [Candidatus Latescibacterota bacterium]